MQPDQNQTTKRPIREIHGARVTKMQAGPEEYGYAVIIADGPEFVILKVGGATYPAGLTPAEARFIARQLTASADRVEAARGLKEQTDA